jgi:hypothetical protein
MGRDRLYREVGEAVHLAQTLEFNLAALISILNRHYQTHIEAGPLIVGEDKRTLGQLIREIQKRGKLDQAGIDAFSAALEARNYVTHHFFIRNIEAFADNDRRTEAIANLTAHAKQIALGAAMTSGFVQGFCKALNISPSEVLIEQDI